MDIAAVMSEVADQLDTIDGLRVFDHVPGAVSPPAAVVAMPASYTYDETFGRGMDRMTLEVHVLVGRVVDRTASDRLAAYMNGSGASSVKEVLESPTHLEFDDLRVVSVDVNAITVEQVEYLGATFQVDVVGSGSISKLFTEDDERMLTESGVLLVQES